MRINKKSFIITIISLVSLITIVNRVNRVNRVIPPKPLVLNDEDRYRGNDIRTAWIIGENNKGKKKKDRRSKAIDSKCYY
jgi:hypothetical protein